MSELFVIRYSLRGEERTFVIRTSKMDNVEAWHWAACDAGVGIIPKFGASSIQKVSRPTAERYGLTDVRWRRSGSI